MSTELVTFLRARLAEEEQAGQALRGVRFHAYEEGGDDGWAIESDPGGDPGAIVGDRALAEHIARWDPARVLRAVAARRAIVDRCVKDVDEPTSGGSVAYVVLRQLATEYDQHPDYREEWRP